MIYDLSVFLIDNNSTELNIKVAIESKGVLVFIIHFFMIEEEQIRRFLRHMQKIGKIDILYFLKLCREIRVDSDKLYKELIISSNNSSVYLLSSKAGKVRKNFTIKGKFKEFISYQYLGEL